MRVCIITADFGNFDNDYRSEYVPQVLPEGWTLDFYYINEENYPYRKLSLSNRLRSKIPKMLGYEMVGGEYDYYIWIDSNITINHEGYVKEMVEKCGDNDILLYNHYQRKYLYDEFMFVLHLMGNNDQYLLNRYDGECINEQLSIYSSEIDIKTTQLYATGVMVYNKSLIKTGLMKEWYYHCCRYNVLCQLSLPYLIEKFRDKVKCISIDDNLINNPKVKYHWSHK